MPVMAGPPSACLAQAYVLYLTIQLAAKVRAGSPRSVRARTLPNLLAERSFHLRLSRVLHKRASRRQHEYVSSDRLRIAFCLPNWSRYGK